MILQAYLLMISISLINRYLIMPTLKIVACLIFLVSLAHAQASCAPFGTRIQYGQILVNSASYEKAVISFNTIEQCSSSYVRLLALSGFKDIACESTEVNASATMNFFKTYVQKCYLSNQISFDKPFNYIVYGWDEASGQDSVSGIQDWVQITMINPLRLDLNTNILVLADWGVIKTSGLQSIAQSLRQMMAQREINLLVVNGDIAYDLDGNNGTKYSQFLSNVEEFISQIPSIFVPGNHQNLSNDDKILLSQTFKMYNLDKNLATGLTFGNLYLLPFDPFNFVYFKTQAINSLQALKDQLDIAKTTQLFIIPFSHYPLVCSGEALFCQDRLTRMYTYFNAMIDAGVSLYIGAHTHDYERTYPYFPNQTFQTLQSPYSEGKGYLVSIIEGVSGSDTSMITDMTTLNSYTASYTISQTGFGILTFDSTNMQVGYQHYSTKQGLTDKIKINTSISRVNKMHTLLRNFKKREVNLARNQS